MKKEPTATRIKNALVKNPLITVVCMTAGVMTASVYLYLTPAQYESTSVIEPGKTTGPTTAPPLFSSGKTS